MTEICWVSMPFGQKQLVDGNLINFDQVYNDAIRPSIEAIGLRTARADLDLNMTGRIGNVAIEYAINSPVMIADLTGLRPNIFYELGVRDAVRPSGTVIIAAQGVRVPFDLQSRRIIYYPIVRGIVPALELPRIRAMISRAAEAALSSTTSPIHELNLIDSPRYPIDFALTKSAERRDGNLKQLALRILRLKTVAELFETLEIPTSQLRELIDYEPRLAEHILSLYRSAGLYDEALNFVDNLRPDQQAVRQVAHER